MDVTLLSNISMLLQSRTVHVVPADGTCPQIIFNIAVLHGLIDLISR